MAEAEAWRRTNDEKLANQLAAFGLLGRTSNLSSSNNVLTSTKPVPLSSSSSSSSLKPVYPEGLRRSYSNGSARPFPIKPVYVETEGFRGWVIQTEPGRVRFIPANPTHPDRLTEHVLPVRSRTGFSSNEQRLVRFVPVRPASKTGSGGTGVFLPRLAVKDEVNKRNYMKKQVNQKQKVEQHTKLDETEQIGSTCESNAESGLRIGATCQSSADSDFELPHEWIY